MKARLEQFKNRYEQCAPREKIALIAGSCFLLIIFIYFAIWQPIHHSLTRLREQIVADQKTIAVMTIASNKIKEIEHKTNGGRNKISTVALLSELQKQIVDNRLDKMLTQLKQVSSDSIELHFKQVNFDKLITVLSDTCKKYRTTMTQFSAVAQEEKGVVNADMIIKISS